MLFGNKGRLHLPGHKHLTDQEKPRVLTDFDEVYIPLLNMNDTNFDVLVEVGDKVKVGQKLAQSKGRFYVPIYSSVSGEVKAIEKKMSSNLVFAQHIVITNDKEYSIVKNENEYTLDNLSKGEIIDIIKEAGITGCGGSGFPTYVKYSGEGIHTILINAVECEPYITIDYVNLLNNVDDFFLGLQYSMKACGANKVVIAFKKGKKALYDLLSKKIDKDSNIELRYVPDVYPMGWERTLIKEIFNQTYQTIPSELGIVVDNSTTVINIGKLFNGTLNYQTALTLSGDALKSPTNVIVPTGTRVSDIVDQIGGYIDGLKDNEAHLIMGGPMMGKAVTTDEVSLNSYNNAANLLKSIDYEEVPCLRCSRCVEYCPAGLQSVAIKDAEKAQNLDLLKKLHAEDCVSCGLCSYVCPSKIEVTDYTTKGKKRVLSAKQEAK